MFRRLLENIAKGLVIWSRMMTGIYVQSGLNWRCPQLFVAHVLQPSFILIVVKHELHSKPFCLRYKSLNRTNYIFYIFILRCSTMWFVLSGDVLPLLLHSTPAASYSCYSEHIAPLGPLPHSHPHPLPRFLPCPCAPSIQSSQPLHLLPWRLILATARPSGWSILADCSPLFDEGCQHAD